MKFEVKEIDKAAYQISATVPYAKLEETYQHVLEHFKEHTEVKGFRKGMAPLAEVEKVLDEGKLYGEVVNHLLPQVYSQAIKENHLKPIISPRIKIKEFDYEGKKDLVLEITTCVKPEVKLGEYGKSKPVEKTQAPTPSQPSEPSEPSPSQEEKQAAALKKLLDSSEVAVPQLLIDEEIEHSLARLVDKTEHLGITMEQYLKSTNKSPEILRAEYAQKAQDVLKQEFVLMEIAEKENIKADDQDITELIKAAGDEKVQTELSKLEHRAYLKSVIIKRKVIEAISL